MLKKLILKGFESHKNTSMVLSRGVNVILGDSDEGKSGIVRGMKWCFRNRPQGDEFRNDDLKPKNLVSVSSQMTNGTVTREKNKKTNQYRVGTEEIFKALRTDVPDEVTKVTKIKDINIQGQHPSEQYFMLTETPGQVAKKFNAMAGLSIMDKAQTEMNSQVRQTNAELKLAEKEIKEYREELEQTEWVPKAYKTAKKLVATKTDLEDQTAALEILKKFCQEITNLNDQIDRDFDELESAKADLKKLTKLQGDISATTDTINTLSDTVKKLKKADKRLAGYDGIEKARKELKTLENESEKLSKGLAAQSQLEETVSEAQRYGRLINLVTRKIKEMEEKFQKRLKKETCPLCGRTS